MSLAPSLYASADGLLSAAQRVVLVTHINPDGDAIGTLLGVGNWVRGLGKQVVCAVDGGVPSFLDFLPQAQSVLKQLDASAGHFDLCIMLDCADDQRAGKVGEYALAHTQALINLDHHATNPRFGTVALVDETTASAAEVATEWILAGTSPLSFESATPLLTGIITDTQGFATSATKPRTLALAQALMEAGAPLGAIIGRTLRSHTYAEFLLWREIFPSVRLEGRVLSAVVSLESAKRAGFEKPDDAGLVGWLNEMNEAAVVVIFKQIDEQTTRLSLRCKEGYDVAQVAAQFGGGGHVQAAGASFSGSLEQARAAVMPLLQRVVAQGDAS